MSTVWFTSDTHFLHKKLALEIRGFETEKEHDEALIANFNGVIKPEDAVFHLGDFSLKNPATNMEYFCDVMARLNGYWNLISGNHDSCWSGHRDAHRHRGDYLLMGFESVQDFAKRKLNDNYILLSHFPYAGDHTLEQRHTQFRLRNEGLTLLHGHTHAKEKISWATRTENGCDCANQGIRCSNQALQIHVGLDAWGLMPVSIDQIVKLIQENR